MSFDVGVVGHFTARHHLVGDFGPASQPHSHDYRVDASVTGLTLRHDGTLFDITILQNALAALITDLDDRDLNDIPALADPNPTAEVVARFFFDRLKAMLGHEGLRELTIRVWESPEAYASYTEDLPTTSRS
jgi:6-pyruvoyltetrahydropterin/6-carboxytetrahydropterin synthase